MNTKILTIEHICAMMDARYTLVDLDHSCNLNNSVEVLAQCIKERSATPLYEHITDWFFDVENDRIAEVVEELKSTCSEQGYPYDQIEECFVAYEETIREQIQNRDDSDVEGTLLRNTADFPIRIEMHSNYDCINSHGFEDSYSYRQSYFGDMVDRLNLNPHQVEQTFRKNELECVGDFPNLVERNGHELVSYLQFAQEVSNSVSPANLLTFMATINVTELFRSEFTIGQVTISRGNCCGLYSPSSGGGAIMAMELQYDLTLSLKGRSTYDYCSLQLDADPHRGYALKQVYGVEDHFFGKAVIISKEDLMFGHLGNGVTICDRLREEHGDYLKIAHIARDRKIIYYHSVSDQARERIERFANEGNMSVSVTKPHLVLKPINK